MDKTTVPEETATTIGKKFSKQDAFIEQIIMNPSKSKISLAIKAGYAIKAVDKAVSRLMNDKVFLQRLEDRKDEIQVRLQVTADKVAEEYARIAFLDPRDTMSILRTVVLPQRNHQLPILNQYTR